MNQGPDVLALTVLGHLQAQCWLQIETSYLRPQWVNLPVLFSDSKSVPGQSGDSDEEEVLDLLYDPVLNCYFDPKTCKYYELTW